MGIVTVAEKHCGSQDSRTAFSYISRIIISQQFRYFLTCLYFQCYRIKMSAQTRVEVTRGVFDPRTYKQVKGVESWGGGMYAPSHVFAFISANTRTSALKKT